MELANLDLNLLLSLQALLHERSVSRAAERVGIGQPSMSAQLGKLRRHFGDNLLVRSGNVYLLTPLAVELLDRTDAAVAGVRRVFAEQSGFNPQTSRRDFRIMASDYALSVFIGDLVADIEERAPHVCLHIEPVRKKLLGAMTDEHRAVDALVIPHGYVDELPYLDLFHDEWVCLVAADNEAAADSLTIEQLAEMPWVVSYDWPSNTALQQLKSKGVEPKTKVVTESFTALPFLLRGTNRVTVVQKRLADLFSDVAGLKVLPCPFGSAPFVEALWWHPSYRNDMGHRWLRDVFAEVATQIAKGDADRRP